MKYHRIHSKKSNQIFPKKSYKPRAQIHQSLIDPFIPKLALFLIILAITSTSSYHLRKSESHHSYITLTLNKVGTFSILGSDFKYCPDEVYINDINFIPGENCKKVTLTESSNRIKLVFNNEINSTLSMFYRLSNILYIDLSHFNTSLVKNMKNMFSYCYDLTSVDLTNLDTSSVTTMEAMFQRCLSLSSLDLRGLNTSKVLSMRSMFNTCRNLAKIDFSTFITSSVKIMEMMFWNCSKLTSVDLTHFDTSNVTTMD